MRWNYCKNAAKQNAAPVRSRRLRAVFYFHSGVPVVIPVTLFLIGLVWMFFRLFVKVVFPIHDSYETLHMLISSYKEQKQK